MNNYRIPLNVRLLAILVGGLLVLGIVVFFFHRSQVRRQSGIFLKYARTAREAANTSDDFDEKLRQIRKASANYQKYSRLAPQETDVVAEHGMMLADAAKEFVEEGRIHDASALYSQGLHYLEKVLREEPQRRELRRSLVRSLAALRQSERALDHIALLASVPTNIDGLRKLFDRHDLWQRFVPAGGTQAAGWREDVLEDFLLPDSKVVDRDRLVTRLQDDLWMALDDPELLSIFGECQIRLNRPELAEKPLKKAVLSVPGNLDNYVTLARLLRRLNRDEDADYWMSEMVSANPDSFEALRKRAEYRVEFSRRVEKAEAPALARGALSDTTRSICRTIEQAVDKADAAAPASPLVGSLKVAFESAQTAMPEEGEDVSSEFRDRLLEAVKSLKALGKSVSDIESEIEAVRDGLVLAARCELAAGHVGAKQAADSHFESARMYGTAVAELFPEFAPGYLVLADVEQELDNEEKAIEWLRRGSELEDASTLVMWQLASLLIETGQLEQAREAIRQMAENGAPRVFLAHLEATIHYFEGNWLQAKEGFERVLPELAPWPASALQVNLLIARCCEELGLVDQQREALMRAAALDLTSIDALLNLAELEMASGQLNEAIEDYRFVLRLRNAPPVAYLALARALLVSNSQLPVAERNWLDVENAIDEAEKVLPNSPRVTMLRAELLAARDKPREAALLLARTHEVLVLQLERLQRDKERLLKEESALAGGAKKKKRREVDEVENQIRAFENLKMSAWWARVQLAERQKNWKDADTLIEAAKGESGDIAEVRLLKARNLVNRYGSEAALQVKEQLRGSERLPAQQRLWLWRNVAMLAYEIHDFEMAKNLCNRVLAATPDNLGVEKLRFQIAASEADVDTMEAVLGRIKEIENGSSAFWHYGEATRLTVLVEKGGSQKLLQRALDHLERASQLQPKWGQVNRLSGMIHEKLGDTGAAVTDYLEAIDLGGHGPWCRSPRGSTAHAQQSIARGRPHVSPVD